MSDHGTAVAVDKTYAMINQKKEGSNKSGQRKVRAPYPSERTTIDKTLLDRAMNNAIEKLQPLKR